MYRCADVLHAMTTILMLVSYKHTTIDHAQYQHVHVLSCLKHTLHLLLIKLAHPHVLLSYCSVSIELISKRSQFALRLGWPCIAAFTSATALLQGLPQHDMAKLLKYNMLCLRWCNWTAKSINTRLLAFTKMHSRHSMKLVCSIQSSPVTCSV